MDNFERVLLAREMLGQPVEDVTVALILAEAGCALILDLDELPTEPQAPSGGEDT